MKSLIKLLVFVGGIVAALTAQAQPYYLAGDFNGWNNNLTTMSGGPTVYSYTTSGHTAGNWQGLKVLAIGGQWSPCYPGNDMHCKYDATGGNTYYFFPGVQTDGWLPAQNRVGFADPGNMSFELTGDFTSPAWDSDPNAQMVSAGSGVYTNTYTIASAGTHNFKFRTPGTWDNGVFTCGQDFGGENGATAATVITTNANQKVFFQLDLPNGRFLAGASITLTPITFQVDMTEPIASGAFNPNSNTVFAAGTFQASTWSGFVLTNLISNTNIYVGTYPDANPVGTVEQFKFKFYTTNDTWEGVDNRPFTVPAGGLTNAVVYFNDIYPTPSATTNHLNFSINMAPQVYLGRFNPAGGDTVAVEGTFQSPQWTTTVALTNTPNATNAYLFGGSYTDGNYPGSFESYKFVIVSTGGNTFESGTNRAFLTPDGTNNFPLAYFNNISNIYSTHILFQVDMTIPLLQGLFKPGSGDVVCALGEFQTNAWSTKEFVLTQSLANTNVYTGTYVDPNTPGAFAYKFQIVSSTATNYETISNNPTLNRINFVTSTNLTNSLVFWSDYNTNNVLLVPTTISFRVNMNGAVDVFSNAFNPSADFVIVNGDFTTPAWPSFWKDAALLTDYPANVLNETPIGSGIYSNSYVLPAGHSIYVSYKYGIDHNDPDQLSNTNCDNEASSGNDRHRYVRGVGHYAFPLDVFGSQQTNSATGTEKVMDKLAIGNATAGKFPVTWLGGLSGVSLQTSTNLVSGIGWQDVSGTDGGSQTNWPAGSGQQFFRLKNSR